MRVMPWEGSGRYSPGPGMVKLLEKWFYQELRPLMAICSLNPPGNLAIVSDYPRISFGAKLRGGGAIPALISPPARCGNRTAVAMAALPTQRGSHAVIHMVGQRHGPHSSREDLGTNLITRHPGIGSSSTRSLRPLGLDRPCDAVFLDPRLNLHFSTRRFSRWSSGRSSQAS